MKGYDLYKKKNTRFGDTQIERLENGRRKNFERFLYSSPHYATFLYKGEVQECVFEPYKQNETETQMELLCRATTKFDIGEIITISDKSYIFYYLKQRSYSGYNKYVVVELTHDIAWDTDDGVVHTSKAYMYAQQDNMLQNELQSRSRSNTLYKENLKLNFLVLPTTEEMKVGNYMTIKTTGVEQFFRVTGFDLVSTPGVMYVSIKPIYKRDSTPDPEPVEGEDPSDRFWLDLNKKK